MSVGTFLRFVSSLESCVVKTLARGDWGSGFLEVLLWPDPGVTFPGALGRRSLAKPLSRGEWEDGEGVGCCPPCGFRRPFPGAGCCSLPFCFPIPCLWTGSSHWPKMHTNPGPQRFRCLNKRDLIVLVIAYSSDKIHLFEWIEFLKTPCVFMRKNGNWLLFWGGFILFGGDSIRREKVHNVFSVSLRRSKCRCELGWDKYKVNGVSQRIEDNATI